MVTLWTAASCVHSFKCVAIHLKWLRLAGVYKPTSLCQLDRTPRGQLVVQAARRADKGVRVGSRCARKIYPRRAPSIANQLYLLLLPSTHRDCKFEASCILSLGVKYLLDDVHTESLLLLCHGRGRRSWLEDAIVEMGCRFAKYTLRDGTGQLRYTGTLVAATQKISCFQARDCFVNFGT